MSIATQPTVMMEQAPPQLGDGITLGPLTIDVKNVDQSNNTALSRTLKRKFTELEEITQRLKARLFDVTGDANFDPDEEFENDLNTNPEEDEEDMLNEQAAASQQNFDWLSYQKQNAIFTGEATEFQNSITVTNGPEKICIDSNEMKRIVSRYFEIADSPDDVNFNAFAHGCLRAWGYNLRYTNNRFKLSNFISECTSQDKPCLTLPPPPSTLPPSDCDDDKEPEIYAMSSENSTERYYNEVSNNLSVDSSNSAVFEQDRIRLISNALQNAVITDGKSEVAISEKPNCIINEESKTVPDKE